MKHEKKWGQTQTTPTRGRIIVADKKWHFDHKQMEKKINFLGTKEKKREKRKKKKFGFGFRFSVYFRKWKIEFRLPNTASVFDQYFRNFGSFGRALVVMVAKVAAVVVTQSAEMEVMVTLVVTAAVVKGTAVW